MSQRHRPIRGGLSLKGVTSIAHYNSSPGGGLVPMANEFYMLHVKRQSLMAKKESLLAKLAEINKHLGGIETQVKRIEKKYPALGKRRRGESRKNGRGNFPPSKKMALEF